MPWTPLGNCLSFTVSSSTQTIPKCMNLSSRIGDRLIFVSDDGLYCEHRINPLKQNVSYKTNYLIFASLMGEDTW